MRQMKRFDQIMHYMDFLPRWVKADLQSLILMQAGVSCYHSQKGAPGSCVLLQKLRTSKRREACYFGRKSASDSTAWNVPQGEHSKKVLLRNMMKSRFLVTGEKLSRENPSAGEVGKGLLDRMPDSWQWLMKQVLFSGWLGTGGKYGLLRCGGWVPMLKNNSNAVKEERFVSARYREKGIQHIAERRL